MLRNKIQGLEATDPDFPQLSLAERRQKLRIRTYIRLEIQIVDSKASAIVTDLSLDGLRLRSNLQIEEGDRIEVFFLDDAGETEKGSILCRAVWVSDIGSAGRPTYEAGLNFEDSEENMQESWVRYVLEQLGFDENKTFQKRRYLRANGKLPARVFTAKENNVTGEIVNVGVGGALLATDEPLTENTQIHCEICLWRILPALRLPCRILSVRKEESEGSDDQPKYLHSLLFLGMDTEQVKLLGNYVIYLINQAED